MLSVICPSMTNKDKTNDLQQWRNYVLLPAEDVPRSGSRTEIVVTQSECLRVEIRVGDDGLLQLRLAE